MDRSAEFLRGCLHAIDDLPGMPEHMRLEWINRRIEIYTEWLAAAEAREGGKLTKGQWIAQYGGQAVLDHEGFDVVPCVGCGDSICHGWRVVPKQAEAREAGERTAAEVIAAAEATLIAIVSRCVPLGEDSGDSGTVIIAESGLSAIARYKEANHAK